MARSPIMLGTRAEDGMHIQERRSKTILFEGRGGVMHEATW